MPISQRVGRNYARFNLPTRQSSIPSAKTSVMNGEAMYVPGAPPGARFTAGFDAQPNFGADMPSVSRTGFFTGLALFCAGTLAGYFGGTKYAATHPAKKTK